MEVLLNILWFALCNLVAWCWLRRWRHDRHRRSMAVQLWALVCLLVLLFPVISATDDLYAARAAMEVPGTQKSSKGYWSGRSPVLHPDHPSHPAFLPPRFVLCARTCV